MDIAKAKRLIELTKPNSHQKILVTLWQNDKISSCVEDSAEDRKRHYCETCDGNGELCDSWVDHLKSKGYKATEIELADLGMEESLPRFLEKPQEAVQAETATEPEESPLPELEGLEESE